MFEINVTIKAPELSDAINNLATALSNKPVAVASTANNTSAPVVSDVPEVNPTTPASVQPVTTAQTGPAQTYSHSEPEKVETPTASVTPPSIAVLSTAGARLCEQGKMPQLITLLGKYGVQAVTQLKDAAPDKLNAFAAELKALGAEF